MQCIRLISVFNEFVKEAFHNHKLIVDLAKKDFQCKYLGSYLGIIWGFIQPAITVVILWFVFQVGFKVTPINDFPFILWLLCGMIPWFFFSDAIINATGAFIDNSYLVKQIVFKISVLPIVKVLSSLFVHLIFILVLIFIFSLYGYSPNLFYLQIFYYLFGTIVLVLSISVLTSSIIIFVKDIGQIVALVLQILFWMTPIFWNEMILPLKYRWITIINPLYYLISGYRNTLIYHKWFWEEINLALIFWSTTLFIFMISITVFRRLKPHFADAI